MKVALEAPRDGGRFPASAPAMGPADAPVTIVAFTDYPVPLLPARPDRAGPDPEALQAGKVRLVHRDFPLDGHPQAFPAARAARCAGEQGKFWEYHESLMIGPRGHERGRPPGRAPPG